MRFSWAKVALATVLAGVITAPVTSAMAQQALSDVKIDITLKDADMLTATNMLFMRAGISFVVEPSNEPYQKITLKLENVTPEEAVAYICKSAGAHFRRDENGVYVISHHEATAVSPTATPVKRPLLLKRIKVLRASAEDIYDMLKYDVAFSSTRGFERLRKFQETVSGSSHSNMPVLDARSVQGPYQTYGPASGANVALPIENSNDISLPGESPAQLGRGGGGGGFGGGQGGFGGGQGGIGGGGGGQGGLGGQGGGGVQLRGGDGLVPDGIDFISYDPTDNSLVVRGDEDSINTLQTYITMFDVAPKQVQVKVEFITTTETLDKSFGTEFLYQRGTVITGTRPGSFVRSSDPIFLNYATGNITARLRTSLTEGGGQIVAAPILRTLNNQPATVTQLITSTVFTNSTTVSNGTVITTSNPVQIQAPTTLSVAPRINDDNTITMFLTPSIGSVVGTSRSPDGQEFPNFSFQSLAVVARVRNNETVVLGGLNSKNEFSSNSKVPVLADLPIIGQFFKFRTVSKTNSELLVFVTPTIIDEDSTSGPGGP